MNPTAIVPVVRPGKEPTPVGKSRLVVVEQVYHQQADGQPTVSESKYSRRLDSDEQPYGPRRVRIGEEWTALDVGWVGNGNLLVTISNEEGKHLSVYPSESERRDIASRVIELAMFPAPDVLLDAFSPLPWVILPGESFRGSKGTLGVLKVRCRKGSARIVYTVYPS